MYFDLFTTHYLLPASPGPSNMLPSQLHFLFKKMNSPLSPVSTVHMHMGVGPCTRGHELPTNSHPALTKQLPLHLLGSWFV